MLFRSHHTRFFYLSRPFRLNSAIDRLLKRKAPPMSQRRMAFAWIACFAVLFNMLAMPLSGAAPKTASEQVLWGSFCTASGTKLVAISLGKADHSAPHNDDHSTMQHCWCCSGSAPLVAIPASFATWYASRIETQQTLSIHSPAPLSPRQQWPSLNPRASPRV